MFLLSFLGLGVVGIFLLVRAAFCAPLGEEDHQGFHFTTPQKHEADAVAQPPLLTSADMVFFNH